MHHPAPIRPVRTRIFLSSTNDPVTREYRLAAREILKDEEFSSQWIPVEMDQFTPSRTSSLDECRALVLSCDVYIGLMGPFYGSRLNSEDPESLSFTEYEYRTALDAQREIGIFSLPNEILQASPHQIIVNQGATLARQETFKHQLNIKHMTKSVVDLEDFKAKLRQYIRTKLNTLTFEQQSIKPQFNVTSERPFGEAYDRKSLPDTWSMEKLDKKLVKEFLATQMAIAVLDEQEILSADPREHMLMLGLIQNDGQMTLGAVMSLGLRQYIIQEFGSCSLHMVVYTGIKKDTADQIYRREVEDNLINLFRRGMLFFRRDAGLKRIGIIGSESRDELEIPELALREALANALVHRDYSEPGFREQPTRIEIYRDRIEIVSFGDLLEGVSIDRLNTHPETVVSRRRNPLIAKIFMYMKLVELSGSGIARMQETMGQFGLPDPKFELDTQAKIIRVSLQRAVSSIAQQMNENSDYVYIASASADLEFVARLSSKLRASKVVVAPWSEQHVRYGTRNWEKQIRTAIRNAKVVIYVISSNSYNSDYVQDEISLAQRMNIKIILVWASGEDYFDSVPLHYVNFKPIDMRGEKFEVGFKLLLEVISEETNI